MTGCRTDGSSPRKRDEPAIWHEVRDLWRGQLSPIPSALLESTAVPSDIRAFLISVGLPTGPSDITFFHDERLLQPVTNLSRTYLVLGKDYGIARAVDPERRTVSELYLLEPWPPRFVNSSLPLFLVCLGRYLIERDDIYTSPDEADAIAERLKREFSERDPAALADETSAWSVTLQEMGDGLV